MSPVPHGVIIRLATRDEAEAVAATVRRAFVTEAEIYGADVPPLHERAGDVLRTFDAGDVTLVAVAAGAIVGTVRGETLPSGAVMIRRLGVDAEWRGLGIARALMAELETAYADAPRIELFTGSLSAAALALYDSLGYQYVRAETVAPGVDLVYLGKRRS
jgi:ribosomal protein S18 acetylase RimI-like enzyme